MPKDQDLFRSVSMDYARFCGDPYDGESGTRSPLIHYYVRVPGRWNPIHRESEGDSYGTAFSMTLSFLFEESENKESDLGDTGLLENEFDASCAIPVQVWQEQIALYGGPHAPKVGDVLCQHPDLPEARWFGVITVKEFGIVRNGPGFTEWAITLKGRSSLSAEREIPARGAPERPRHPSQIAPSHAIRRRNG